MPRLIHIFYRRIALLLAVLLLASLPVQAQKRKARTTQTRSVETVKKDRSATERKISETATKLSSNSNELKRQMNRLSSLNADIETSRTTVESLRSHIDSLGAQISITADSVKTLEKELEDMRRAYVKAMRELQPAGGDMSKLSFIFSSKSFTEAFNRIRYLRRFSAWRERKAENIRKSIDRIAERRARLSSLRHSQDQAFRKASEEQQLLSRRQSESLELVAKLRKEDGALRKMLEEQKRKQKALDRELDRLIAEEQARIARENKAREEKARKAAQAKNLAKASASNAASSSSSSSGASSTGSSASSQATAPVSTAVTGVAASTAASSLTGSFEANKGRLLFPVTGAYKIVRRFGRQPHPTLPHVEVDNSGIDIEVNKGSSARAVFAGKVSYILKQDGYNSIVMVRHGNYITIYAGLATVSVRQGESVKAGQNLGSIFSDPEDGNRTRLHFEIRNERQKLNPSLWVK